MPITLSRPGIIAAGAALAVSLFCLYAWFDPSDAWWMPKCPVKFFTGFDCPGCGSQRAIHALLHGDLAGAFGYNAILFLFIPLLALTGYAELTRSRHPALYRRLSHPLLVGAMLVLLILWGVARNFMSSF